MSGEAKLDDQPPDPSRMAAIKKGAQMYVAKKIVDILEWLPKKRGQKLGQVKFSYAEKDHYGAVRCPPPGPSKRSRHAITLFTAKERRDFRDRDAQTKKTATHGECTERGISSSLN